MFSAAYLQGAEKKGKKKKGQELEQAMFMTIEVDSFVVKKFKCDYLVQFSFLKVLFKHELFNGLKNTNVNVV